VWFLLKTNVLEKYIASIIKVTRISELGTALALTSSQRTLQRNTMLVLARDTQHNIPEDGILYYRYIVPGEHFKETGK
jgi:hypothetical protein